MSNKLPFTPEFGATLLSKSITDAELGTFKTKPADFLKSTYDIDLTAEVKVIENNNDTINLTLPYYSELEQATADMIADGKMDSASGGEIVVTLAFLVGGASVWGGIATGAVAAENARYGRNIDGSHK